MEIFTCPIKGRSIRTLHNIKAGHFVCEYKGELLTDKDEVRCGACGRCAYLVQVSTRSLRYDQSVTTGSYMFELGIFRGKRYWCER